MRPNALAPLRDTLLLALGLGGCTPKPVDAPPPADGRPPVAQTKPGPAPASGHVREEDNTVHRASAETCVASNPRTACTLAPGSAGAQLCTADTDCHDGANPRCIQDSGQIGEFCQCDYSCATDRDCKSGEVCVCGEALGAARHSMCVTALCQQDSECASGICGLSVFYNGCGETRVLACRTEADTCKRDADCGESQDCTYDGQSATWSCKGMTCIIGRPLLVDGAARTAAGVTRHDWHDPLDLSPPRDISTHTMTPIDGSPRDISNIADPALDPATARALATHWQEIAALEHASVASFARFTLELMALAAPPDLLAAAQRAALDEVEHARLAYALASRFAGQPIGPGPLRTADLGLERPLAAFVAALVQEGCVGETLGAAEAELLATQAEARLAARLHEVAADETRHAALAWRTLHWLLGRHGEPVREAARHALADCAAQLAADPEPSAELTAPAWGLLPRATLLAHRRLALDTVVRPLLATLLDVPPAPPGRVLRTEA